MTKTNKRVLLLTNIPSPYRVDFFNELGKLCDLTVLFERRSSDVRDNDWHNYNFINFKGIYLNGLKKGPNTAFCPEVTKFLRRDLFDSFIVGGYATPTGMLAINYFNLKKIPFILSTDGGIINKNDSFIKRAIKKYYISSAALWLSTGKATTEYLHYYGASEERTYVYPFTTLMKKDILEMPSNNLTKDLLRKKLNINEEKTILTVGQFIPRKGFDVLLKACTKLPKNYGIYIVGGEPTKEYQDLKENLNLTNVHFIGFLSKEELKEYYMASNLFVLPTREDIWGLVVNEAMAYGLPVITTERCVAGLELVENKKNGFVIPVDNVEFLSEKINEILGNNELLNEMSNNSLDKINRYTVENMAIETLGVIEKLSFKYYKRKK